MKSSQVNVKPHGSENSSSVVPALEVRQVSKTYSGDSAPALNNVSLRIHASEILGLLGPNGAGKTTAISIISTLLPFHHGHVHIYGTDILQAPNAVRQQIGLVPQNIALYSKLSALENLRFFGQILELGRGRLQDRCRECLELVGLAKSGNQLVGKFSGGMKRRMNLAVGLLHQPKLLLLDEPTVGIDAQSRDLILSSLVRLKESGIGVLYTTHYMEEAEKICDTISILESGRIILQGPPSDLLLQTGCTNLGDLFLETTGRSLRD